LHRTPAAARRRARPLLGSPARLLFASLLAAALVLALAVSSASALVVSVEESGVVTAKVGEQPRSELLFYGPRGNGPRGIEREAFKNPAALEFANPKGAPIVSSSKVYAIYWDPTGGRYNGDWQELINGFLQAMGAESGGFDDVFSTDAQYTDKANQHALYRTTYMGSYVDTEPYPANGCIDPAPLPGVYYPEEKPSQVGCLTDAQIQVQLKMFIADHHLTTGMSTVFYVLTPPGVTVCLDGGGPKGHCSDHETTVASYLNSFCSYHSDISPTNPTEGDANTILYGMIPWTAGTTGAGHFWELGEEPEEAYACQDGGYDPSSKPIAEKHEEVKEKTKQQIEEEKQKEKTKEETAAQKEEEKLEGPHIEEPNQTKGDGPDGYPDTGLADLIINQIAVEQQNIVTDPLLNAWQDPEGKEATDECRNYFTRASEIGGSVSANEATGAGSLSNQTIDKGNYYLNDAFDLAALKLPYPGVPCVPGVDLYPRFTAPNPVNAGEIVGFDGMESDITLNWGTEYTVSGEPKPTYALYKWNFGDGSPEVTGYAPGSPPANPPTTICELPWRAPCASSTFHSYQYGGTYQVTLTVTDTGGYSASVTEPITVEGPPPPSEEGGGSKGGGSGGGNGGGSGAAPSTSSPSSTAPSTTTAPGPVAPGPLATAAALSSSLKQVAKSGLVVRYSVNEQVAGRFEVLLNAATAHRLGIGGPAASGLPAGSPPSLVIGQALLVTTKGGHSAVRIKFPKRTAKRLRHAHRVTLMLRLKVRNASKSPLFTTVTSTVILHR
jgi:hypothetical protein